MSKNNTFIVSDETLNDKGFRVLTAGIDITQFERNPIMLVMHFRYNKEDTGVIGRWENLRKENGKLLADAVFDMDDEVGAKIAKKVENGFLKMASVSVKPVETSINPKDLLKGQKFATVSKSKLIEISIVDRGSNDNAIKLYGNGDKDYELESLSGNEENENQQIETSNMKEIKKELGLSATASDSEVLTKIQELKASEEELTGVVETQKETQRLSAKSTLKALNLSADDEADYMELAKTNFSLFEKTVGKIKLSADSKEAKEFVGDLKKKDKDSDKKKDAELKAKGFEYLSANNPDFLTELRANEPEEFEKLLVAYENS